MDARRTYDPHQELDHFLALLAAALVHAPDDVWLLDLLRENVAIRRAHVEEAERRKRLH